MNPDDQHIIDLMQAFMDGKATLKEVRFAFLETYDTAWYKEKLQGTVQEYYRNMDYLQSLKRLFKQWVKTEREQLQQQGPEGTAAIDTFLLTQGPDDLAAYDQSGEELPEQWSIIQAFNDPERNDASFRTFYQKSAAACRRTIYRRYHPNNYHEELVQDAIQESFCVLAEDYLNTGIIFALKAPRRILGLKKGVSLTHFLCSIAQKIYSKLLTFKNINPPGDDLQVLPATTRDEPSAFVRCVKQTLRGMKPEHQQLFWTITQNQSMTYEEYLLIYNHFSSAGSARTTMKRIRKRIKATCSPLL